jgi:hypothetical protein
VTYAIWIVRRVDGIVVEEDWATEPEPDDPFAVKMFTDKREADAIAGLWRISGPDNVEYHVRQLA